MPEVSPWLRRSFIVCNTFLPIVCGPVVFLAGLSPSLDDFSGGSDFEGQTTRPIICYVVGSVAMLIAILGIYGAVKEDLVALAVYLVLMITGSLLVLRAAVPVVPVARSQLESRMEGKWRSSLPLDQASNDVKNKADALQKSLHCCGLFSYEDWQQNIPDSCLCDREEEEEGKCQTVDNRNFLLNLFRPKKSVFRQNCFPLVLDSATTHANIKLCSAITLLLLALLSSVLSSLIIVQIFNTSNVSPGPLMFTDRPPAYQLLHNLPEQDAETKARCFTASLLKTTGRLSHVKNR